MAKTVAILGAGPSGLVAAKEALENGLVPTIFEKLSNLGGIWNPLTGSVWNSLKTNISKYTTVYGDADWPAENEMFPSSQEMFDYLSSYADKNKLRQFIKFNCDVVKVSQLQLPSSTSKECNRWEVQWACGQKMDEGQSNLGIESTVFDGVIVATGIFNDAYIPNDINGLETFKGRVIHSKEYKRGEDYQGKNVLVVGGSFSGAEISGDVSHFAKQTIHSFRKSFWILERYLPDSSRNNAKLPLDWVFYNRKFYNKKSASIEEGNRVKNIYLRGFCLAQEEFEDLKVPQEDFKAPISAVISDQYLTQTKAGKLIPKRQNISEIEGSKVKFESGEVYDVDLIIFATGFNIGNEKIFSQDILNTIGFDGNDRLQPLILFNATLHPDLKNIFFVGMYKGPYFAVMEQQARLACRILSNKVQLPSREVMIKGLDEELQIRNQFPRLKLPHLDYVKFADNISALGNSLPDLDKLQLGAFSLKDAIGKPLKASEADTVILETRKAEICKMFMNDPVIPPHFNLVDEPKVTVDKLDRFRELVLRSGTQ